MYFQKSSDNVNAKHDVLLRKITESGPNAFQDLIDICQSNFWDAADFLSSFKKPDEFPTSRFDSVQNQTELTVERDGNIFSSFQNMSLENISLELYKDDDDDVDPSIYVRKAVEFCQKNILVYPMKSKNRGVLFLVNIIEIQNQPDKYRNGAILDKQKLITLFRQFGFKIFYYENITLKVSLNLFIFRTI